MSISNLSQVHPKAQLGKGVTVEPFTLIEEDVEIGENCWIGSKVTVLDGVTIGDNCVLAAGAVITKSMPANSVIGGVPAKILRVVNSEVSLKIA